jgi:two-component system, OmpR family, response regulator
LDGRKSRTMTTFPSPSPSGGQGAPAGVPRILLVDDDPDILEVALLALRAGGFVAEACADSRRAVAAALAFQPQLVLLDAMMPVMDGVAVLREFRANPDTAAIPVVFLTARSDVDSVRQYLGLGARGVIAKPFDPLTICSRLAGILACLG